MYIWGGLIKLLRAFKLCCHVLQQANMRTPHCASLQSVCTRLSFHKVSPVIYVSFTACHNLSDLVALIQGTSASYLPLPLPPENTYRIASTTERQQNTPELLNIKDQLTNQSGPVPTLRLN